ncbi:unnamed protein product, partial [Meganyctiphanes norvegica]
NSFDIELPYKPKPVQLSDQEKENLKIIRPKTYNRINKTLANNSISRNIDDLRPVHIDDKKSSVDFISNPKSIRRNDLKNNEISKRESIGSDFLNRSSFLINNQKSPRIDNQKGLIVNIQKGPMIHNQKSPTINQQKGQIKHLEDISKNPSRRNSSEFGQRGYVSRFYHTWDPETFCRPNDWHRRLYNIDWRRKLSSPSSLNVDEEDYYFGNIPFPY